MRFFDERVLISISASWEDWKRPFIRQTDFICKKKMDQRDVIAHQLMIVGGIILFIFGLFGNILNICVFKIWSRSPRLNNTNRTSNSPLYLLISSIANIILICYGLITRILFDGYQIQITKENVFLLCKFRYYVLHSVDLISLTCICLATFDRYLISSRKVRLRQMSKTREETKFIIFLLICLVGFHSIPLIVYYNVSNIGQCFVNSTIYLVYYRYMIQIFLHGIIPIVFFSLFAFLTFRQLKTIQNRLNIDKQLSRMLLLMSITIVLSSIPYTIENIYYLIFTNSSQEANSFILFFHIISSLLFYTNPVCSFYIYYISTRNFRLQVRKILLCKIRNNQINIITNVEGEVEGVAKSRNG